MFRTCLWIGLAFILAGCGTPHADLELQHRILVLEQQVQELQEQETSEQSPSQEDQAQEGDPEPLLAAQELPLESSPEQKDPEQDSQAKEEQEQPAAPDGPQDQVRKGYKQALDTLLQGEPEQARGMFQEFLQRHKGHELVPNAYYWLGECHYEQQSFAEAILAFKEVSNQFPDSDKVPDALLKMGYSYLNMGQESNASFYLETLQERYPETKAAELAQEKLAELDS
ncbi:MAG: tol-pal system protein YbgF [Desulfohalobiaceae bacterium]